MTVQLYKVNKRGADKLLAEHGETGSARRPAPDNLMVTEILLDFGATWEPNGKYRIKGSLENMEDLIQAIASNAVVYDFDDRPTHPARYSHKARKPFAAEWLRKLADKMTKE